MPNRMILGRLVVLLSLTTPASAFDLSALSRVIWGMQADTGTRVPTSPEPGDAPAVGAEPEPDLNSGVPGYVAGGANPSLLSRPMIEYIGDQP
jgi:hypothetical protein